MTLPPDDACDVSPTADTPRPSISRWDQVLGYGFEIPEPRPEPKVALRPRQQEAVVAVFRELSRGVTRPLVELPTGVGKTIFAGNMAGRFSRVLFLVNRTELLKQTLGMFARLYPGETTGRIHKDAHEIGPEVRFVVGMVQTVAARTKFPPGHARHLPPELFDLVIIDEAHHAVAPTWSTCAKHFTPRLLLGLTATPERADGASLEHIFERVVYSIDLETAVREELLVKPVTWRIHTGVNIGAVPPKGSELDAAELERAIDIPQRNALVVRRFMELGKDPQGPQGYRKAVGFTVSVNHALHLAEAFAEAGVRAEAVYGRDPDRPAKLARHAAGESTVLLNPLLLTEGYDDQSIRAVLLIRPTMSRGMYVQQLGRGLRLHHQSGKVDCLVIDYVDNAGRHDLQGAWKFFGDELLRLQAQPKAESRRRKPGDPVGAFDEAAYQLYLSLGGAVQLDDFSERISILRLPGGPPRSPEKRAWHVQPATDSQLQILGENGYDVSSAVWTRGQAAGVIDGFPLTARQALLLLAFGHDIFYHRWTRKQAEQALQDARQNRLTPNWIRVRRLIPGYQDLLRAPEHDPATPDST